MRHLGIACFVTLGAVVISAQAPQVPQAPLDEFRLHPIVKIDSSGQQPLVKVTPSSANVKRDNHTGVFQLTWPGASSSALVEVVTLDLEGPLPKGYEFTPVRLHISRLAKERGTEVVLAAAPRDASASTARWLNGRAVKMMSLSQLTELYPRARASAVARMAVLRENWRNLDDYTVQAVYKYLQIALWLAKAEPKTHFLDEELDHARLFLAEALALKPRRVYAALESDVMASQLLEEFKIAGGAQWGRIWATITSQARLDERCSSLTKFRVESKGTPIVGLHEGHVLSALAQCHVALLRRDQSDNWVVALNGLESSMVQTLRLDSTPDVVRALLRSDIGTIRQLGIRR